VEPVRHEPATRGKAAIMAASATTEPVHPKTRTFGKWVDNAMLEDYSLRYAPRSFRTWSSFVVASAALGGIAYLVDFAIGASIAVTAGFTNAILAILLAAVTIFITGIPIAYYSAKYHIDMDLLTRGAGFGYLGSTLTSLIYASFTFIFFALEGAVMGQALTLFRLS
jgi:cytosine/uracil/thiamine/allantoin permease